MDAYNGVKARLERYLKSIGTDGTYYELGTEGLDLFVSHSLEKEKEELRALSTYMTVRLCYEDVKCELLKIKEQSLISIEELEKCLDVLKMREKTMREKSTMAACRMRDELKGRIYYNISCAHQKLYTQMCQEIYKTIDASENIKKTQKEIPGFVESTVEKFMNNLVRGFEKDLMILGDELDKQMRQDAGEYFKDIMWGLIEYPGIIQRKDSWMFVPEFEIVEPEQIEKTRKVSNAMLFFSLPFFLKGKLFRAFGAAAGSWALKKKAKEASEEAAVELLKEVVKMECHNMQIGQLADIKEEIYQLADEAEKEILHAYDCFIDAVINEMYDRMEEVKLAYSKKEILEQIFEEELPLIESKLDIR